MQQPRNDVAIKQPLGEPQRRLSQDEEKAGGQEDAPALASRRSERSFKQRKRLLARRPGGSDERRNVAKEGTRTGCAAGISAPASGFLRPPPLVIYRIRLRYPAHGQRLRSRTRSGRGDEARRGVRWAGAATLDSLAMAWQELARTRSRPIQRKKPATKPDIFR